MNKKQTGVKSAGLPGQASHVSQAHEGETELGRVVYGSVEGVAEQLANFHKRLSHTEERLDALTSQVAALESRVHEDLE